MQSGLKTHLFHYCIISIIFPRYDNAAREGTFAWDIYHQHHIVKNIYFLLLHTPSPPRAAGVGSRLGWPCLTFSRAEVALCKLHVVPQLPVWERGEGTGWEGGCLSPADKMERSITWAGVMWNVNTPVTRSCADTDQSWGGGVCCIKVSAANGFYIKPYKCKIRHYKQSFRCLV